MVSDQHKDLDADGIRVVVTRIPKVEMGSPVWVLPLGGGSIRISEPRLGKDGYIFLEVEPNVELPITKWRSYKEIDDLIDRAEAGGGYMKAGDTIQVGGETLVGRDVVKFLEQWNRRLRTALNEKEDSCSAP